MKKEIEEWINDWIERIRHDTDSYVKKHIDADKLKDISKEELITVIYDLIDQYCYDDKECSTDALSCNAEAIAILSKVNLADIHRAYGRMAAYVLKDAYGD